MAHLGILDLLPEACRRIVLPTDGRKLEVEVDLGRPLGRATCITTPRIHPGDTSTFAWRHGRHGPSRVVRATRMTQHVSTVLVAAHATTRANEYALITAFVGRRAEAEPWGRPVGRARDRCLHFWCSHALVHDPEVMGKPYLSTWTATLAQLDTERGR